MNFVDRIDPALRDAFELLSPDMLDLNDVPGTRVRLADLFGSLPAATVEGVQHEDRYVPGPPGDPDVRVRIYQPTQRPALLPALFWIHGGGYVLGSIEDDDAYALNLAKEINCVVVSVEYRLAPEYPFPAPMEDCYAGLKWLAQNATELGVDPQRIAIGGASAGGGMTAGLALLARDRGEVKVCFQLPIYPMIDDRNLTPSSRAITEPKVWNRQANLLAWKAYTGLEPGDERISPYAAATRASDLSGLPPAYIPTGELDLFLDENIDYAQRLLQAGVPTELHIYPGAYHGFFVFAPDADVSQRCLKGCEDALKRALHG